MQVRIWGCRGSLAAPGADTVRYGGNTSCVEVRLASGHALVLDAGTGMRPLGVAMQQDLPVDLHILLTHLHLDHLQGLGFFRPLFSPGLDIQIWGPTSPVQQLEERIARYLSPPLFPVHLDDVPSNLSFHDAPETAVTIGSATVRAGKVTHQGPTVGYRIEEDGQALVYLPDHEPAIGTDLTTLSADWMSGYDLARDADLLLHDAQYHDHEYGAHVGWGHSSITDTIEFANKSGVGRVMLFHHDPYHDDDDLEELLVEARSKWRGADEQVQLASEHMTITLEDGAVLVSELPGATRPTV
jgi:phosphoribosyl 1,2-cyclic phosphodiesterase